jgi:hypothetical protein
MGKRERSNRAAGIEPRRREDWEVVFVPDRIELELVGIVGPGDGISEPDAIATVLLEEEDGLLDLVESLRESPFGAESDFQFCCDGAAAPGDRPIH